MKRILAINFLKYFNLLFARISSCTETITNIRYMLNLANFSKKTLHIPVAVFFAGDKLSQRNIYTSIILLVPNFVNFTRKTLHLLLLVAVFKKVITRLTIDLFLQYIQKL